MTEPASSGVAFRLAKLVWVDADLLGDLAFEQYQDDRPHPIVRLVGATMTSA
jgi:hypothetical protein